MWSENILLEIRGEILRKNVRKETNGKIHKFFNRRPSFLGAFLKWRQETLVSSCPSVLSPVSLSVCLFVSSHETTRLLLDRF
jgi:hypothetical protein